MMSFFILTANLCLQQTSFRDFNHKNSAACLKESSWPG
jgi:hypothetical protein